MFLSEEDIKTLEEEGHAPKNELLLKTETALNLLMQLMHFLIGQEALNIIALSQICQVISEDS